jgi:hypothetical protein
MTAQSRSGFTVLVFGDRPTPRSLAELPAVRVADTADIDAAAAGARRLLVVGAHADLAGVLSRLMRKDSLDVEVAHVRGWLGARRALSGTARRVPLIRDDTGTALVGAAQWLPPPGAATIRGEAVVDDAVLFDGEVAGVRIEPTAEMPGLRATLLGGRRRWVTGRAAQLGTTGARVERDGVMGARELKRSTFYRHTKGWLRVG